MAKKNIESILHEERRFEPSPEFRARARVKPKDLDALQRHAAQDYVGFWADLAREQLAWHRPFSIAFDDHHAPNFRWFIDGELNVCYNVLDVHLEERGHKTAIIFEGEPGDTRRLSYRELHAEVCRFANALRALGIHKGDRVVIYMPLVPEIVIAMLACARIGAVHSVVFGGFSALSLRDRIEDAGARLVITADGGNRGGHVIPLKATTDKALAGALSHDRKRDRVSAHRLRSADAGRPRPVVARYRRRPVARVRAGMRERRASAVPAVHVRLDRQAEGHSARSAGYLLGAKVTCQWVFDLNDSTTFSGAPRTWAGSPATAMSRTARSSNGATVVMYEGAPTIPDAGRFWKICETHGVTVFYTAPTAIRALMKLGDGISGDDTTCSKLRLLGSVGEPINPEAWMWYHARDRQGPLPDRRHVVADGDRRDPDLADARRRRRPSPARARVRCPASSPTSSTRKAMPCSSPSTGGYLVIRKPWPSMLRTIWGDNERYISTYWERFQKRFYVAGDSAHRDADGYYWIMGRIDDVLNVAGHRLGTMEIESALVAHARVAEAAVVGARTRSRARRYSRTWCARARGPPAIRRRSRRSCAIGSASSSARSRKPDDIRFADNLPKTRSGKIMRRLLRAIARGEEITQDVSTLENPAIIDQLRGVDRSAASAARKQSKASTAKPVAKKSVRKRKSASAAARKKSTRRANARTAKKKRATPTKAVRVRKSRAAARRAPARKKK